MVLIMKNDEGTMSSIRSEKAVMNDDNEETKNGDKAKSTVSLAPSCLHPRRL